ncbi:MAG TPA: hypothetical protein VK168_13295 [Saprospiraceae bacterium]|nr:hypothetical protein [Saprospiraceae bacterium]
MELLFDEKVRTDPRPSTHLEGNYQFLDRCSFVGFEEVRKTLNAWFFKYPIQERAELKQRFIKEFSPAFFELFLFEFFCQLGYEVIVHPIVPGTTKRPDFLVKKGNFEFYVEAKEATDLSESERSIRNINDHFYDQLNQINSPNFFLWIKELNIKSSELPRFTKIRRQIEHQINSFDPDIIKEKIETGGLNQSDSITYEDEKVRITISLIPKTKSKGIEGLRPIGIYEVQSFWGDTDESIKTAIKKKASRYGHIDKPYLICINSTGFLTDDYSILSALFGSLKRSISTNSENLNEKWFRERNGIFVGPKGPQFTRLSGIFITSLYVSNLHIANYQIYSHPFSKNPLEFQNLGLSFNSLVNKELVKVEGKSIKEILNIPSDWFKNWNFDF